MTVPRRRIIDALEGLFPPHLALAGDATGLQVGTAGGEVERVLCTLDLTLEVAEEARERGAGLVVSHHAVVFRPLPHLRTDTPAGRILAALVRADVTVYVPHTALDVVAGGGNDDLAARLGLGAARPLEETGRAEAVLLLAPRPPGDVDTLERSLFAAGAARVEVVGQHVHVVAPRRSSAAVAARLQLLEGGAPPRVVPLLSDAAPHGIGRVGELPRAMPLAALGQAVKTALGAPAVRLVARDPAAPVTTVAVLAGDGRRYVDAAAAAGAEVLVTGDVDHHTALRARALGLALIDAGHWATERRAPELLAEGLRAALADEPVEVLVSGVSTQPFVHL